MAKDFRDITLALAGICQASRLVQQIAYQGNADEKDVEVMINSIFNINPTSTLDVYGNQISHLKLGFQTIKAIHQAVRREKLTFELMTYQQGLINLERIINKNNDYSSHLSQKISQLERQKNYFEPLSDGLFNALAGVYSDAVSPVGPKIQVNGSIELLKNPIIQAKVRGLLLTGLRSAVLWRQVGGRRFDFLLHQKTILRQTDDFLAQC
ncbi:TPA: high frequency lysogenization protein HflD [Proteus mirabilis]|uniref:high frequency lysogenization protein HflD n=1 Tax=Proteus TaxID=583 RepID=UPI000DEB4B54|nr:high frequency lysogenization protein HflD [Proteus mirabilis]NBN69384.1 high frequency lysogenization protein HflD [Proteus sp. G2609]ELT0938596.1 high frequency lysogenization protein HflD [Proteus mirabilis]MBG2833181.1 high frequency lysogenization protein HflD [Proteus mirabilis]MBG2886476.1 high frequency lysogenization protein HflD [Proteus mirabilis]MBG3105047.1 high frequency lysogenization protein HflD [Proteus mirabilis]